MNEATEIINRIKKERNCGIVNAFIFEISLQKIWKDLLYNKVSKIFLDKELTKNKFKNNLVKINSKKRAKQILSQLLHKDMAYDGKIISTFKSEDITDLFFGLFEQDILYYSNSEWNINEYNNKKNEFGLRSWNSMTKSTFDSGLIIVDKTKMGIIWFEDED